MSLWSWSLLKRLHCQSIIFNNCYHCLISLLHYYIILLTIVTVSSFNPGNKSRKRYNICFAFILMFKFRVTADQKIYHYHPSYWLEFFFFFFFWGGGGVTTPVLLSSGNKSCTYGVTLHESPAPVVVFSWPTGPRVSARCLWNSPLDISEAH